MTNPEDLMLLFMFFVAAAVMGHLTTRLSQKERVLRSREQRTRAALQTRKGYCPAQSVGAIIQNAEAHLEAALGLTSKF